VGVVYGWGKFEEVTATSGELVDLRVGPGHRLKGSLFPLMLVQFVISTYLDIRNPDWCRLPRLIKPHLEIQLNLFYIKVNVIALRNFFISKVSHPFLGYAGEKYSSSDITITSTSSNLTQKRGEN
jgi:hypothetical protein